MEMFESNCNLDFSLKPYDLHFFVIPFLWEAFSNSSFRHASI